MDATKFQMPTTSCSKILSIGLLLTTLFATGCGSKSSTSNPSGVASPSAAAATGPKTYTVEQLSKTAKLADSLPALDSGRIELAAPEGWNVLPRDGSKKHLIAMLKDAGTQVPQIKIFSKESPLAGIDNLTTENAQEVITQLGTSVARPSVEPNQAIVLGDNVWIREVRRAELQRDKVAVQSLTTIRGKRLFVIEMIVKATTDGDYAPELKKYRDGSYLMAAEMKFLKPKAKIEPKAEAAAPPEETPPVTEGAEKDPMPM